MPFHQGHALLIGVGSHQHHSHLDVPITVTDARAVAGVLQDDRYCGYPANQVKLLHDAGATKAGILAALDTIADQSSAEGTVFLFYCGHGAQGTDGNYYLVSHDAKVENGRVVAGSGVSEAELLAKLRTIRAQRVLMIFNACHSGSISPSLNLDPPALGTSNPNETAAAALLGTGQGRVIIVACREEQVSYIGKSTNTIFTQALLDSLQGNGVHNNNGYISAFSLYENLYETVREVVEDEYSAVQEPELTILKGVGPFAVALYKGASTLGGFNAQESLPGGMAVREVRASRSQRIYSQRTVNTGGGAYIGGNVNVRGDVIHGDKIGGDKVAGDKVSGDQYKVGNIQGPAAFGPNARATSEGGVNIGSVEGGIHGSTIAGRDIHGDRATGSPADDPFVQHPALRELRALLSVLYGTEADARRLAHDSDLNVAKVDFSSHAENRWHALLVEAHKQGKVKTLVKNAVFDYDTQADELKQALSTYEASQASSAKKIDRG